MLLLCKCGLNDFFQPQLSIPHTADHLFRKQAKLLVPSTKHECGFDDHEFYNDNCIIMYWTETIVSNPLPLSEGELEFLNGCLSVLYERPHYVS